MADNTENNIEPGGDGIPSVGDDDKAKKKQQFIVGLILLVASAIAILYMAAQSGGDDKGESGGDDLEAQVADEFETANRNLVIPPKKEPRRQKREEPLLPAPDLEPKQEKKGMLARPTVELKPEVTETPEEKKARKKAEQMWEKRRKAAPVVFDAKIEQAAASGSRRSSGRGERHTLDIDKITESVMDKVGGGAPSGSFLGGGSNSKDKMAQRLQSAQTVGVTASYLADKPYTIAEGKMIGCVLETAIHSALPGMTRCVLAENIYSYDGQQLLLKKGSRLVGQYEGGIQHGEDRIFVIWTRIITPEGIDVALSSPGTGELGRAGHGVYVDSHFFERFGASALLSIIGGLSASESDGDVRLEEVGKSFNQSAEIALKESIKIRPTGHKNQGERVKVFVARDIDFGPVLRLARERLGG